MKESWITVVHTGDSLKDKICRQKRRLVPAQAVVAADSLRVVAAAVVQAPTDKQQLQPMLNKLAALPEALGKAETLLAMADSPTTRRWTNISPSRHPRRTLPR